jgi:hypothetical protein
LYAIKEEIEAEVKENQPMQEEELEPKKRASNVRKRVSL